MHPEGRKKKVGPEYELQGTGTITVILVINLGRFMAEEDWPSRQLFRRLRGSETYAQFLRQLRLPFPFKYVAETVTGSDRWIEEQGHDAGVFRGRLVENWFFPTFEVDKDKAWEELAPEVGRSVRFEKEWKKWDRYKLRFTRNGFLVIKLERDFKAQPIMDLNIELLEIKKEHLSDELRNILELLPEEKREAVRLSLSQPLQWQLAYEVIRLLIKYCPQLAIDDNQVIKLQWARRDAILPIRDRYVVIFLSEMQGLIPEGKGFASKKDGILHAHHLYEYEPYSHVICALLEGALIGDKENGRLEYPEVDKEHIKELAAKDLSSWEDELCIFAPERALIYCPIAQEPVYLPIRGSEPEKELGYADYWRCIIRGIEHIIALKAELQLVKSYTTREMDKIPLLTERVTTGGISQEEKREIEELATAISSLFNMLPPIRDVLVAPSAFRASYAIRKFDYLMDLLGLYKIEAHIEKNIEELNFFLSHYNNMVLQQDTGKLQEDSKKLQVLALGFGLLIGFLGLASLLKDSLELHQAVATKGIGRVLMELWVFPVLLLIWSLITLVAWRVLRKRFK